MESILIEIESLTDKGAQRLLSDGSWFGLQDLP
jgi:hypothetical protein